MPDLDIVVYACCESAHYWEKPVGNYIVRWEPIRSGCQYGYTCTCPSFKFRKLPCKHIREVEDLRCGWHQFEDNQEPVDGKCPHCKEPVKYERWAT